MTPRERFLLDKVAVKRHLDIADDSFVERTMEVALSEMLWRDTARNGPEALYQRYKLEGAKEFIRIWQTLGERISRSPREEPAGLLPEDARPPRTAADSE